MVHALHTQWVWNRLITVGAGEGLYFSALSFTTRSVTCSYLLHASVIGLCYTVWCENLVIKFGTLIW